MTAFTTTQMAFLARLLKADKIILLECIRMWDSGFTGSKDSCILRLLHLITTSIPIGQEMAIEKRRLMFVHLIQSGIAEPSWF